MSTGKGNASVEEVECMWRGVMILGSLQKAPMRLFPFRGSLIEQAGPFLPGVRDQDRFTSATFNVVKTKGPILLGLQTFRMLAW